MKEGSFGSMPESSGGEVPCILVPELLGLGLRRVCAVSPVGTGMDLSSL